MDISIKELEPCKLDVYYKISGSELDSKSEEVFNVFKSAPVSGFRKGKAPRKVIKQKYSSQIKESLKRALLEEAYHNVLFEKNITPLGTPQINSVSLLNDTFECAMVLHVKPTFDVKPYDSYVIPKPHLDISVNDLAEKMMQELRVKLGDTAPFSETDTIQMGDNVIVNYSALVDGQVVENLCAQGELITVGISKLKEFDDNLVGMKLDEERKFSVVVPEAGLPSLIGKTIDFTVSLQMGSRITPCALDDEMAKKLNKQTFLELREMVQTSATSRIVEMERDKLIEAVSNSLVNDYEFVIPEWLFTHEAKYLASTAKVNYDTLSDVDKVRFSSMASKNVKLSLILDKIRSEDPESHMTDEELHELIKQTLLTYARNTVNEENVDSHLVKLQQSGQYQVLAAKQFDEFTLNYVIGKSKIVE